MKRPLLAILFVILLLYGLSVALSHACNDNGQDSTGNSTGTAGASTGQGSGSGGQGQGQGSGSGSSSSDASNAGSTANTADPGDVDFGVNTHAPKIQLIQDCDSWWELRYSEKCQYTDNIKFDRTTVLPYIPVK